MPRSRNIKLGFFENEHLGPLHSDIRLLFTSLWTLADRDGILEYRVAKIRTHCFRYRADITDNMINGYLTVITRLDNGRMLSLKKLDGIVYILIHNFIRHQQIHNTEKKGKLPTLEALKASETANHVLNNGYITVREPLENALNTDLLNTDLLNTEREKYNKRNKSENFEKFWEAYPKYGRPKGSQKKAFSKFNIAIKKTDLQTILKGVRAYETSIKNTGASNADAFRWLEDERWADDYEAEEIAAKKFGSKRGLNKHERALKAVGMLENESGRPKEIDVTPGDLL